MWLWSEQPAVAATLPQLRAWPESGDDDDAEEPSTPFPAPRREADTKPNRGKRRSGAGKATGGEPPAKKGKASLKPKGREEVHPHEEW